jgi:cytochrome oxidase Cu insertion factor (SCO1/SenC/PrrC family)
MNATMAIRRSVALGLTTAFGLAALGIAVWVLQGKGAEQISGQARALEGLQVFRTLPDFSLTERSGRRITLADLRGKVWIANFIYTHCTDTCPLQSARMARLQDRFGSEKDLRLVSITVDPARDTPTVLANYAARFGADPDRWLFLTGEKRAIYALAQQGFYLSVEEPEQSARPVGPQSQPMGRGPSGPLSSLFTAIPAYAHSDFLAPPFLHSSRFVLVDRQTRIRGYYRSDEEDSLRRLRRDTGIVLREDGA